MRIPRGLRGPLPWAIAGALLLSGAAAVALRSAGPLGSNEEDPAQDAPQPPRPPRGGNASGCLAEVPRDAVPEDVTPAELRTAVSLSVDRQRDVSADNRTVLLALTIAQTLKERLRFADVVDFTEERVEVCAFNRTADLDPKEVLLSLALGNSRTDKRDGPFGRDVRVLVEFRTTTTQSVRLDEPEAIAALAVAISGGVVELEDVVTVNRSSRTERSTERVVALDRDDTIAELAIPRT